MQENIKKSPKLKTKLYSHQADKIFLPKPGRLVADPPGYEQRRGANCRGCHDEHELGDGVHDPAEAVQYGGRPGFPQALEGRTSCQVVPRSPDQTVHRGNLEKY